MNAHRRASLQVLQRRMQGLEGDVADRERLAEELKRTGMHPHTYLRVSLSMLCGMLELHAQVWGWRTPKEQQFYNDRYNNLSSAIEGEGSELAPSDR